MGGDVTDSHIKVMINSLSGLRGNIIISLVSGNYVITHNVKPSFRFIIQNMIKFGFIKYVLSFQNNNGASKKKSSNFHAKTLAEIKHSLSQFERTEQAQQAQMGQMGRPVSSLSTTSSNGNYSDYVNYLMNFGYDEVGTVTKFY